jgi:hypothetical protein
MIDERNAAFGEMRIVRGKYSEMFLSVTTSIVIGD